LEAQHSNAEAVRDLARIMLEDRGYTVSPRGSGRGLRHARQTRHIDLVLADVVLPGMSGAALVDLVRKQPSEDAGDLHVRVTRRSTS